MYKKRSITEKLRRQAAAFPVVAVTGARQVGKSTLLRHEFGKGADMVVFDPVVDVENARRDPELFLNNHKTPLILDEVQYAPEVIAAIKRRVDKKRTPGQYLLTGSQQWGVLKTMAESLAGRVVFLDLEGFSLSEIAEAYPKKSWLQRWIESPQKVIKSKPRRLSLPVSTSEQLWRGWFPEAQRLPLESIPDFFQAYLRTYIERDVRLLADVSDLHTFSSFVRLVAALTAQEVNFSELGRELGLTSQTAKRWLHVLEATFQWFSIPSFTGNLIKRISGKPKGYFFDTGLACYAQAVSSPVALLGHPLWGAVFETAVVTEIRKCVATMSSPPRMYHWKRYSGAEVDLILERDGVYYPIEIKASSQPSRKDTLGMSAFRAAYPHLKVAPGLVVCPTQKCLQISELDFAMPWDSL
ncbi:MAG: ATP-binding protein [bacterium]|nr:ATP-binding protein [bacterium]